MVCCKSTTLTSLTQTPLWSLSRPQKLAPEYAKAATTLKAHDPTIVIAKVRERLLSACPACDRHPLALSYEGRLAMWFLAPDVWAVLIH